MKHQPLSLLAALGVILALCTGCPYESKYTLSGEPVKYSKDIVGSWHSEKVELKLSAIDDYELKVHYNDHDSDDPNMVDGIAKVIKQGGNTYMVLAAEGTSNYYVAKVLSTSKSLLQLNILDDAAMKDKSVTFSSEKEFSDFVFNNKSIFPDSDKTVFNRDKKK